MARSVWKGPFVEESLIKKVEKQKTESPKRTNKNLVKKVYYNSRIYWC